MEHFGRPEVDQMLDPKSYVGLAAKLTAEAVNRSRKERELDKQIG